MDRLRTLWEFLRTSLWFVPTLMAVAAAGLAAFTMAIERSMGVAGPNTPWILYVGHPEDARSVLATLLSSMITMATLVFSITMVVLTLAASQFGPRLIRSFMAHPQTQFVLGTFVMTVMYCLLMLLAVDIRETSSRLPYPGVSMAAALTIASVALLVGYLHTLARSIVSETVIDRVADELDALLETMEPLGSTSAHGAAATDALPQDFERRAAYFGAGAAGYVQMIQFSRLLARAQEADLVIVLYFRAGHYVVPGAREFGVYPAERLNDQLRVEIQNDILVGTHRTPTQDPAFPIRHLEEIGVRALSPGVNDPYTAIAVIDRLSGSLSSLMSRRLDPGVLTDSQGVARVLSTAATYGGLIGESFNQIRQNGCHLPAVTLHLLEAIDRVAQHARLPDQHTALEEQAAAVMEASRQSAGASLDRRTIEERYDSTRRTLESFPRRSR